MIFLLKKVDNILKQTIASFNCRLKEDEEAFRDTVPTIKNLAKYCFEKIKVQAPSPSQLDKVRLFASDHLWVGYG